MKLKMVVLGLGFICLVFLLATRGNYTKMDNQLHIITPALPFSADPMKYDYFIHHIAFTSVYSTLVTTFQGREIKGVLAKKWSHDTDFKTWEFELRDDLRFSNGDLITANNVLGSLKRIVYLKRKQQSQSGLFEFLVGFDSFNNYSKDPIGISVTGNILTLRFTKTMKDVLEKISFGIYSVVHSSSYDPITLEWNPDKKVISSGAYEVLLWNKNEYVLKLRDSFNPLIRKNRIGEVHFKSIDTIKTSADLKLANIVIADSSSLMINDNFEYISSPLATKIGYIYCYGWNKANNPLNDVELRKWLRELVYQSLESQKFNYTTSFFPEIIEGVKKINRDRNLVKPQSSPFIITTHNFNSTKLPENNDKKSVAEIVEISFDFMSSNSTATLNKVTIEDGMDFNQFDLVVKGTGVDVLDPIEDIRFMFLSKQGIKLPDSSGLITEELKGEVPNVQKINQLLWDQAIIWPLRHYSTGLWIKKDSKLNFAELNVDSMALDFQFISRQ